MELLNWTVTPCPWARWFCHPPGSLTRGAPGGRKLVTSPPPPLPQDFEECQGIWGGFKWFSFTVKFCKLSLRPKQNQVLDSSGISKNLLLSFWLLIKIFSQQIKARPKPTGEALQKVLRHGHHFQAPCFTDFLKQLRMVWPSPA